MYLYNRLPNSVLSFKSSLEILFKAKPEFSMLKVFGCACFPNLRPYNKHKLLFKSDECTFIGYSLNHKGYNYLDISGRIFSSLDVVFN